MPMLDSFCVGCSSCKSVSVSATVSVIVLVTVVSVLSVCVGVVVVGGVNDVVDSVVCYSVGVGLDALQCRKNIMDSCIVVVV